MRDWSTLRPVQTSPAALAGIAERRPEGLVYRREYEWRAYPDEAPMVKWREDPNDPESAEIEEPARWWSPRSRGFRAKILVNPTGGELRHQFQTRAAMITGAGSEQDHLLSLADRVVAWEYVVIDDDTGDRIDIPPPASDKEAGWQRFYDLPSDAMYWLVDEVEHAHHPKALATRSSKPSGHGEKLTPTPIAPELEPPPS